ncbi:hypothetical protein KDJ56_20615 [Brevibacillus composti]|uniref:Uncharacterized protein n=1 Tax=Brevibacillus composti TaxID=2796470 RepID=A0A7T5EKD9_9BACL|nr:DUF6042 family protein [Brevibacillus composti]QQE74213.1 hypothetical protein JD108_20680 [Brevibacillus composti]QUO41295.1 hypothetical protein KDJ56_20615 [Brevibacillus composti]
MQTIREVRGNNEDGVVIPSSYTANGWSNVLPHEMNVLFHALCYAVKEGESKAQMREMLDSFAGLKGTFAEPTEDMFKSKEDFEGYVNVLERHKRVIVRSGYEYPTSREEALALFEKWGILLDQGDVWDIPIYPFPDAMEMFDLTDEEKLALAYVKLEALIHPIFSRLVLALHERDDEVFHLSKADLKQMLNTNDAMLTEVLIKLTPYLEEPIENMLEIPDDQPMTFSVVWERIYEDFLGQQYSSNVQ